MPDGRAVGTRVRGNADRFLLVVRSTRIHQPDVRIRTGIRLGSAVTDKSDLAAIRRPGRAVVLVVAVGELDGGLRLEVMDIEMGSLAIQIADIVLFEHQAVDHPGPIGFLFDLIADRQQETFAVWGPFVASDAALDIGNLDALATAQVQGEYLRALVTATRHECQVLAVGAPPRPPGGAALGRHRERLATGGRDHPQARLGAVVLEVFGTDRIGDPGAIRADPWIAHPLQGEVIVHLEVPKRSGILRPGKGSGVGAEQQHSDQCDFDE